MQKLSLKPATGGVRFSRTSGVRLRSANEMMFGIEPAHVDRERVRENARKLALGLQSDPVAWEPTTEIGQAYADEAEEIEKADWALGD